MVAGRQFSNPFPKTEIRQRLEAVEIVALHREDSSAGRASKPPRIPQAFLARMKAIGSEGSGLRKFRRPEWIAAIARQKGSHSEALDALAGRVLKNPTEANLREASMIVNEFGRLPEGGNLLRSKLTQAIVDRLLEK